MIEDYQKEKQQLAWMTKLLEQQRIDAYQRQQEALPFNQRELPFTDEDVRRIGGSDFTDTEFDNEEESSEQLSETYRDGSYRYATNDEQ